MPSIERLTDPTIMREITEFREKSNAEMALISAWQGYEEGGRFASYFRNDYLLRLCYNRNLKKPPQRRPFYKENDMRIGDLHIHFGIHIHL